MTALCLICLLVSMAIAIYFVVNWIISFKNKTGFINRKKSVSEKFFNPFSEMVAGLFVAITVLFIPVYWYGLSPGGTWSTVFKTFALSVQNALQLFVVNASFDNVREMISSIRGVPDVLADVYTAVVAMYFVVAPLLTAAAAPLEA